MAGGSDGGHDVVTVRIAALLCRCTLRRRDACRLINRLSKRTALPRIVPLLKPATGRKGAFA